MSMSDTTPTPNPGHIRNLHAVKLQTLRAMQRGLQGTILDSVPVWFASVGDETRVSVGWGGPPLAWGVGQHGAGAVRVDMHRDEDPGLVLVRGLEALRDLLITQSIP